MCGMPNSYFSKFSGSIVVITAVITFIAITTVLDSISIII
jgi:hypothetical protein